MQTRNVDVAKEKRQQPNAPMVRRRSPLPIAVAQRRQTPEEQRRFNAVFELFLAELVRLYLDRTEKQ